jgi:hypothetical protein
MTLLTPKSALGVLIIAATDLLSAIDGTTDQFEPEAIRLQKAITEATKLLEGGAQ